MRILVVIVTVFLLSPLAFGQAKVSAEKDTKVKDELRAVFVELNEAFQKRDRTALERIYADEFVWIHSVGYIDDKTAHINDALSIDTPRPLPLPTFDQLHVYGDVAIFRTYGASRLVDSFVNTSILVKKDGRWRVVQVQGTSLLPERKAVKVDARVTDSYVGKYETTPGNSLVITREGETLVLQLPGIPKRLLTPASDVQFFDKLGSEYNFYKGEDGKVAHFVIRLRNGREVKWKKVG